MDAEIPSHRYLPWPSIQWRKLRALILLASVISTGLMLRHTPWRQSESAARPGRIGMAEKDEALRLAATAALKGREGTIIIVDPLTGRIRAATNPTLAFENEFSPGSTIKPFAALAALRAGIINSDSRTLCRGKYSRQAFHTVCSHPQNLPPFNPSEALAYSCNFYFGTLGERMSESQFDSTLTEFGFGAKTDVDTSGEASGFLAKGDWHSQNALGDGGYLRVTPIQLLMAYTALVNGGDLLIPQVTLHDSLSPIVRRHIQIQERERDVVLDGLRGAVKFGTAARADLNSLPFEIMGKTGTSTPVKGFRTQGWFVGFANRRDSSGHPTLGVLVFLKRGHGADAATLAREIFEEYAHSNETAASEPQLDRTQTLPESERTNIASRFDSESEPMVRVHLVNANSTIPVPLEQYVLGVVATEGSTETQVEALKALAVASRTYALANLGRHQSEGYDFCTTTHCQRFSPPGVVSDLVRNAVQETEGEVLRDENGHLIASYFSASCGGETANIATLWGGRPNPQLKGVTDEYCEAMPHGHWIDTISNADLLKAVRSDPRTDVGNQLRNIFVARRDATGRAEAVTIVGDGQKTVRGWDFKIIVGRALGWNLLKSSRFQISRAGSNFVFRGSGFGHGLGLCQEGAHVMGQRGFGYRPILAKYFPGSIIVGSRPSAFAGDLLLSKSPATSLKTAYRNTARATSRLRIANEHFRIEFPASIERAEAEYLLQLLESNRSTLLRRSYLPAGIQLPLVDVFVNETTGDFVGRTGLPPWAAAGTKEDRIEFQPIDLLKRRGVLETTVRHELVHKLIERAGCGTTPRWLAEGLALYLAGEGGMIARFSPPVQLTAAEIESKLEKPLSNYEMRSVYASAYAEVNHLIKEYGEAEVWRRVITKCAQNPG